ncbi:MAG: methyl-accepting chemotaxis protein [Oscillospiraceae bacterium]|nr:methyl-accepting chemotaxis protein [Oscillospiraceae bacterium]
MRNLITNDISRCVGCTRCLRACCVDEANIARKNGGQVVVEVDSQKCIACGACIKECHHGARGFQDDTERFFRDLQNGVSISVIAAPAIKTNFDDYKRIFSLIRSLGVKKIYDVSLGADICTWAHIRYIQKNGPSPLISQPCPAIVNYILMHKKELITNLSPVHSPMLCTAVYMNKYEKIDTKIAALSPCIAKSHEFDATDFVHYNVTFKGLSDYISMNSITLPDEETGFDNYEAGLGTMYSMPGGLKECVEHYIGKHFRIDKSEGPSLVYSALDEYAHKDDSKRPVIFDVLNCAEGCNLGTGCNNNGLDFFDFNTMMDDSRKLIHNRNRAQFVNLDKIFSDFDRNLKSDNFIRKYTPVNVNTINVTHQEIEEAFAALGKAEERRDFNCGACGHDSCANMARKIAKGLDIPTNCREKAHSAAMEEHKSMRKNVESFHEMLNDIENIKGLTGNIVTNVGEITEVIASYNKLIEDIEKIAMSVNIISLNASIEAARAGEHGKAFGVVAEEIRKLAADSAESAERTKAASSKAGTAVSSIKGKVREISKNVNDTYERMSTISAQTRERN